ncbi:MAG: His-Xaa-Ser system radical SAM maturase HxsB [Candidatus Gracilibacteria bacterium]|nr:His-Xaa-Ser system radical SAM maturase HxsB [Candidatus Gracilibacteria bacterium]
MLDLQNIKTLKSDKIGFFRFKKFGEDYLITNDIAKYSFLTKGEFNDFIAGKLESGEKYDELLEKKFIKNNEYEGDMALAFAKKNQFLAYGPSLHIIVTSLRCNHKCQYCHAAVAPMTARDMDMTTDTAKKVVDTIFYTSNPNLTIEFQGGESLVNWDIVKYITEYAEIKASHLAKNVTFALVTNLTLMDEEKLKYLIEHNIYISTSLDGDEETHNFNRTFKEGNSFEKVTYWIKRINQEYEKRGLSQKVGALLTVTKKALPKYKEIIDTYVNLGLHGIFLRPLNPYGFAAADLKNLGYSSEEFVDFYKKSMDYILELNKKGINFSEMLSSIYLSKILTDKDPNYLDERSPCGACIGQVAYNYDGKIYSCDEGRMLARMGDYNFQMGEVGENAEDVYKNMINSDTTKTMVQASTLDGLPGYNDSVYKPYIGVCPIHSYKTTGNVIPNYSKDYKRLLDYAILDYIFEKLKNEEDKAVFKSWVLGIKNDFVVSQCELI